jgi:hypothetical protein
VSRTTHSLINRLLTADPRNRLTAVQLEDALETVIGMWRNLAAHELSSRLVPEAPAELLQNEEHKSFSSNCGPSRPGEVPTSSCSAEHDGGNGGDDKRGHPGTADASTLSSALQNSWTRVSNVFGSLV